MNRWRGCVKPVALLTIAGALVACGEDEAETPVLEEPAGYSIDLPPLANRPIDSILSGTFEAYGDYGGVAGRAQLYRSATGETTVQIYADGLAPGVTYPSHVHSYPCAISQGGGHYKLDPTVDNIVPENEIWPSVTADDSGIGVTTLTVPHTARRDAQSVILHDPMNDNTKMVCADLRPPEYRAWNAGGGFAPFAYASEADGTIGGTATLTVGPEGTRIDVAVEGLRADQTYTGHLHVLPCGVADGGGHYKLDPTIDETLPENELWPTIEPDEAGSATYTLQSAHPVRPSAQSVVIHRVAGDESPKVACADLVRDAYEPVVVQGRSTLLPIANTRGYDGLVAEATLTRNLDGSTQGVIAVQGVNPNETYSVHLHAYSCAVGAGGGHYKIDTGVQGPIASNEMWLDFTSDGNGNAAQVASFDHLARPDATAFVIHDSDPDGARIACIDLR